MRRMRACERRARGEGGAGLHLSGLDGARYASTHAAAGPPRRRRGAHGRSPPVVPWRGRIVGQGWPAVSSQGPWRATSSVSAFCFVWSKSVSCPSAGMSSLSAMHAMVDPASWVPDSQLSNCENCSKKFGVYRRKHHCRNCGHIFCWECSKLKFDLLVPAKKGGYEKKTRACRVCDRCFDTLSDIASSPARGDEPPSLMRQVRPTIVALWPLPPPSY